MAKKQTVLESSAVTSRAVRSIRRRMALTQARFAEVLSVTPLTVHRWETGQTRPLKLALARLRELEEGLAQQEAHTDACANPPPHAAPPLDFAGDPAGIAAVVEALHLAHGHQFNASFASETARIDPLPHQRIAVYERMLEQDPLRFLLADDAGAGKTVMTGLYVREMTMRGRIRRVLVVAPAGLVRKWERELRNRFGLRCRVVASADARTGNPFRDPTGDLVIVSCDTLVGEKMFEALCDASVAPYDLVVFDEAHKLHATVEHRRLHRSQRYGLAEALAGCPDPAERFAGLGWAARHLLLLTATPHRGRDSPYHCLWRLLDPHLFETGEAFRRFPVHARDRYFIRRTREDMIGFDGHALFARHACRTSTHGLSAGTDGEQALYDDTVAYLLRVIRGCPDERPAVRLAMSVIQRRLASSTHALRRALERRIARIESSIDDLRSDRAGATELTRRQRALDRAFRADFFDTHGADDDTRDDGSGEANEDYEDAVLGATVGPDIDGLTRELEALRPLRAQARRLLDSGCDSKLDALCEVLQDPRHAGERWAVFSEHRDTADYLVRRLEALGYSGQVAWIHGNMAWTERAEQVDGFRLPDGARYLVATDAAAAGFGLEFCPLMVNYDVPWNPVRLGQRMGRIHRYGQQRDVHIVSLTAEGTREGRVLRLLLAKLDALRETLGGDRVFDVVDRVLDDVPLRECMMEALTDEGERRVLARLERSLTADRVRAIAAADERVYDGSRRRSDAVTARLDGLRRARERERYVQLLPACARRFVERSAVLLDLEIRGDLDGFFSLAPRRPGALDGLLTALERYPSAARERLCVRRPEPGARVDEPCAWLRPGEPIFDALSDRILDAYAREGLRGGVFTDARASAPYLFHLALITVERESEEPERAPDPAKAPPARQLPAASGDGSPRRRAVVERRLLGLRQLEGDGVAIECPVEQMFLLSDAPGAASSAIALAGRALALRAEAAHYAWHHVLDRLVADRRDAVRAGLSERQRRIGVGFDLRAADLAGRRSELVRAGSGAGNEPDGLAAIQREQRALAAAKRRTLARIATLPDRIVGGEVRFLAHVLAVPPDDAGEEERPDPHVQNIALRTATKWEQERGAIVEDISVPERARLAGLPDWPGFDLIASCPDGVARSIAVKGLGGQGFVHMEEIEWRQAVNLGSDYWLYAVFDCATPSPRLVRVRDPFARLLAGRRGVSAGRIDAASLLKAAEIS